MGLLQRLHHDQEGAETDRHVLMKNLDEIVVNTTLFPFRYRGIVGEMGMRLSGYNMQFGLTRV